ncbi:MAG: DUF935 domain-containing protein [Ignavibacteria bacterium]|jgi:phage gp29-like protein|nr:DUF935 domain-containing protein [Ignavibacteria bacterium]
MNNYLTKELVTRSNNLSFFKYIGILPNPDKLLSRSGNAMERYRELENDPHLWSCIQSRKSGLVGHKFALMQDESSELVYEFVKRNFANIDIPQLAKQMADAVLFGFQPLELVWQEVLWQRRHLYQIKFIQPKPQEYFVYAPNGELKMLTKGNRNGERIPQHKIVNIQHEADYTNPYGQSLLSKAYWSVTFKNSAMRFWVNFIEKFDTPTILATVTDEYNMMSAEEMEEILDKIVEMQDKNAILTSGNINVNLHDNTKMGNVELYRELINLCNAEISKVILSQTLTTEIGNGSYAAAKTHQEIREDVIASDIELVLKGLNRVVSEICVLNFGEVSKPLFI